jgi:hypothetical protein
MPDRLRKRPRDPNQLWRLTLQLERAKIVSCRLRVRENAEFMGFPWETIVKQYRAAKRGKSEPTVDRWAEDFTRFVLRLKGIRKKIYPRTFITSNIDVQAHRR